MFFIEDSEEFLFTLFVDLICVNPTFSLIWKEDTVIPF